MRRRPAIIALCIAAVALAAEARDDWYERPVRIVETATVGTVEAGVTGAVVHVRMKAPQWTLTWESPGGECSATLALPGDDRRDDVYVTPATLTVETASGKTAYRVDAEVSADGYNSMKIDYDGITATLAVGDGMAREIGPVPFGPGAVTVAAPGGGECRRIQLGQVAEESGPRTLDGSLELTLLRVSASDDRNEGVWEYYARECDPARVTAGGRYVLATVADSTGGYDIVYVSGADTNRAMWQPMKVKGRMSPTIFTEDYDLEWIDAAGRRVDGDTYARLSPDGSQLTMGFPAQGATLRFRRVRPADIIRKAGL